LAATGNDCSRVMKAKCSRQMVLLTEGLELLEWSAHKKEKFLALKECCSFSMHVEVSGMGEEDAHQLKPETNG